MNSNYEDRTDLALKYGNFKNYYEYNTVSSRMILIEKLFCLNFENNASNFEQKRNVKFEFDSDSIAILDLGCNSAVSFCIKFYY